MSHASPSLLTFLLNEREAAALLSLEVSTLRRWRWEGKGPSHRKLGFAVRYHRDDLDAFIEASKRSSTFEQRNRV